MEETVFMLFSKNVCWNVCSGKLKNFPNFINLLYSIFKDPILNYTKHMIDPYDIWRISNFTLSYSISIWIRMTKHGIRRSKCVPLSSSLSTEMLRLNERIFPSLDLMIADILISLNEWCIYKEIGIEEKTTVEHHVPFICPISFRSQQEEHKHAKQFRDKMCRHCNNHTREKSLCHHSPFTPSSCPATVKISQLALISSLTHEHKLQTRPLASIMGLYTPFQGLDKSQLVPNLLDCQVRQLWKLWSMKWDN